MRRIRPYLYVAPALFVLLVFVYWPIVYSVWLSLHRWDFLLPEPIFIGVENYRVLLTSAQFQSALQITVIFTLVSVLPKLALALVIAVLIAKPTRSNRLLRSIFFLPVIMSSVAIGIMFDWMMNTEFGLINRALESVGLPGPRWLSSPELAIYSIALVDVWKSFGYDVVIYAAGLQAIPVSYYEASRIDGASPVKQFFDITIPLVMPTTFFLLILSVINSFQVYTFVDVMTQGGPARATEVIVFYLVRTAFETANIGLGSAVAVFLFVLLLAITALKLTTLGRKVHYGYE